MSPGPWREARGDTLKTADARPPTLVAIGNFDGVHRGHIEVLSRAGREANESGAVALALTFDPPPAVVLGRKIPAPLTPLARKIELIESAVPTLRVRVRVFDHALAESSPEQFAREVLCAELGAVRVVVGRTSVSARAARAI